MWPFRREPRFTIAEYNALYATVADKVAVLNEEARKHNMVELGLLPQAHLARKDMLKHRRELELEGRDALGRAVAHSNFKEDPDLCARDD